MRKFHILWVLSVLLSASLSSQDNAFLRVDISTDKPLPEGEAVYLRGNHVFLGNWKEGSVRLTKKNESTWSGIFIMKKGDEVSFLIDAGSSDKGLLPYDTVKIKMVSDTLLSLERKVPDIETHRTGKLYRMPNTMEGRLAPRLVTVRTPPGYHDDTVTTYPTLYMHDGQFLLGSDDNDPKHWHLIEVIDSLEAAGAIDPFILVAIDHNWESRSMEYGGAELGRRYRHYLAEVLVPKVDLQFRTRPTKNQRYIGGGVAGGYASTYAALEYPSIFGNVIALSPTYIIMDNDLLASVREDSLQIDPELDIYIDKGEFGMDEDLGPGIDRTVDSLKQVIPDLGLHFVPNTIPNGENFRNRVIPALLYFFGKEND